MKLVGKFFTREKIDFLKKICSGSNNVAVEINSTTTYVCLAHKGFEKKFRSTDQLAIEVSESSPTQAKILFAREQKTEIRKTVQRSQGLSCEKLKVNSIKEISWGCIFGTYSIK